MPCYEFRGKAPRISEKAFVHPDSVIIGDVSIGRDCFIAPGAVIRADFAPVTIGHSTSVQDNSVLHVSPGLGTTIGDNVIIGHSAVLHDSDIGRQCVIGMGAILLNEVICEEGVVVAAGSVVPQRMQIPAGKLAAGNPARIIKDVPPELRSYIIDGIEEYRRLARNYLSGMKKI